MIESVICSDTNMLEGGHIKQIGFQGIVNEKGRPSAEGSHMSGVWGRKNPRQAFPRKIYGEAASNP